MKHVTVLIYLALSFPTPFLKLIQSAVLGAEKNSSKQLSLVPPSWSLLSNVKYIVLNILCHVIVLFYQLDCR